MLWLRQSHARVSRRRHRAERRLKVRKQPAVVLVADDGPEPVEGGADEPVSGPVGAQLVVFHVEARTVDLVLPQVMPECDAAAQAGQILLGGHVPAPEAASNQQVDVLQEQSDKGFKHGEFPQRPDGAGREVRGPPQAAVGAQHREKCLASLIVVRVRVPKVDLGQDLDECAAFRGDHANIVARVEPAVPAKLKDRAVSMLLKRTRIIVRERLQILEIEPVESVSDTELFVLPNGVDTRHRFKTDRR